MKTELLKPKQFQLLSRAQLFVTPWTAAHQAPLSMGFETKTEKQTNSNNC